MIRKAFFHYCCELKWEYKKRATMMGTTSWEKAVLARAAFRAFCGVIRQ